MIANGAGRITAMSVLVAICMSPSVAQDSPSLTPLIETSDISSTLANDQNAPDASPAKFLPIGTLVEIIVDDPVSSKTNKTGDWFDITLAQPIMLNDIELVPAGTHGKGQVVHAAKSGWGGKPGELILAARYLDTPNGQIPLRAMKLGAMGKSNATAAFAASTAFSPIALAINGTSAKVAPGLSATAKLAVDLYPQGVTPTNQAEASALDPKTESRQTTEGQ